MATTGVRTYGEIHQALLERPDEVIEDIQHLLESNCIDDCNRCEFEYLCLRNDPDSPLS